MDDVLDENHGHFDRKSLRIMEKRMENLQELRKFPLVGGPESVGGDMELALKGAFHKIDELLKSGRFVADLCALANPRPGAVRAGDATMVGCTACVASVTELQVVVANAGDSRAVLCRNGRAIALSEERFGWGRCLIFKYFSRFLGIPRLFLGQNAMNS